MANTQAICDTFRVDILNGTHAFGAQGANGTRTVTTKDVFKAALFLASATINRSTTVYANTGELAGTGGYTQGGATVTNATAPANTGGTGIVAFWTPSASLVWSASPLGRVRCHAALQFEQHRGQRGRGVHLRLADGHRRHVHPDHADQRPDHRPHPDFVRSPHMADASPRASWT
jgi:hypothetical protein